MRRAPDRERRVYRTAILLTGDPEAATAVLRAVHRAQPDLGRVDRERLDRLTLLRAREQPAGDWAIDPLTTDDRAVLRGLEQQHREAWILRTMHALEDREIARAMDCSMTAARRHLARAESAIEAAGTDVAAVRRQLARAVSGLDVPEIVVRVWERRRRRRRLVWVVLGLAVALGALLAVRRLVG